MATVTNNQNDNLLRNALRGNGVFSAVTGLIATFAGGQIATWMGVGSTPLYTLLGVMLISYAGMLFFYTSRETVDTQFAWLAVIADGLWVVGSAVILVFGLFELSNTGQWVVLVIADIVLVFAIAQYMGLRRLH